MSQARRAERVPLDSGMKKNPFPWFPWWPKVEESHQMRIIVLGIVLAMILIWLAF
jgi:hypothetical protein